MMINALAVGLSLLHEAKFLFFFFLQKQLEQF